MTRYSIVLHRDQNGVYNVTVPALPGCVTFGYSEVEAKQKAHEVIELWIEELTAQGFPIPREEESPKVYEVTIMSTKRLLVA